MKTHLLILSAGLILCGGEIRSKETPVLKVGFVSDTHVHEKPESAFLVGEAYKLFREHKVDAVVNCGDIADHFSEQGYKHYRDAAAAAYGEEKLPVEFFAYANHDQLRRKEKTQDQIFAEVKKHLKIFHDPESITKLKGYNFVTVRQSVGSAKFEELIEKAVKDTPDKPVFLIDHIPAWNTVYDSDTWGSGWRRKTLEKYPQVVQFSGHVHGTLANELNIWQGKFTAVNLGGLTYWHEVLLGNVVASRQSDMVMIMEVYRDKLVMRRFFAKSKREYQPETPWTVPLPYDESKAVYSPEKRHAESTAPEFAPGSKVSVSFDAEGATVKFPKAQHQDGVFYYQLELFRKDDGKWVRFSRRDVMGDFDLDPRPETIETFISNGYFESNREYKIEVAPHHVFGKTGRPISGEFATGEVKTESTVVFESSDPMKDCPFLAGLSGDAPVKLDADGYYDFKGVGRLVFPDEIWTGPTYTQFRVTVKMHGKQGKLRWTLTMRNPKPQSNGNNRFYTEPGDHGIQRYVIDMYKSSPKYKYYLLIREGSPGKVRFEHIRIERLKEPFRRNRRR
ncbi:MAG: metallophosphoesterase [Lentisphaeria bacterium]|nr:metallophosphoesterase [Lentisphaeria bacterium]